MANSGNLVANSVTPTIESGITDFGSQLSDAATNTMGQTGTKQVLNAAGKVAGALGTLYGAYNIGSDIANAGSHRSVGDMLNTRTKTTITGENGNSYD